MAPTFDRLGRNQPRGARQTLRSIAMSLLPGRLLQERTGQPGPLFTFDDGPHPDCTPRILDVLAESGIKAEFYMIGNAAERHPELVRRVVAEGHVVGNHTWSHPAAGTLGTREYLQDVDRCTELLRDLSGRSVARFRPPHGYLTTSIACGLWMRRLQVVLWSVDPKDYMADSAAEVLDHVRKSELRKGDIVLLHDTSVVTVEALPELTSRYGASK